MGFLGKLFGDDDIEKKAKGFFDGLVNSVQNSGQNNTPSDAQTYSTPVDPAPVQSAAPSGVSWGEVMPAEENQFSFGGSFDEYFEKIYREEFSDFSVTKEFPQNRNACIFTFVKDGRAVLKVELISEKSSPYKIKRECEQMGIGYTRFYFDHHGWWNTRSYVIERTRNAIKQ